MSYNNNCAHGTVWLIAGTRPEAYKLEPLAAAMGARARRCWTGQHDSIPADLAGVDWVKLPKLAHPLARHALEAGLRQNIVLHLRRCPGAVVVQGDTASALAGARAARAVDLPLIHLEAGLRSANPRSPWPEELYRRRIARLADFHLVPSRLALSNLLNEGIAPESMAWVGSTAVDGLPACRARDPAAHTPGGSRIECGSRSLGTAAGRNPGKGYDLLIDVHRRENACRPMQRLAEALRSLAASGWRVGVLSHPNGSWSRSWRAALAGDGAVDHLPLMTRAQWFELASRSRAVLSDSGGAAEELPYLGVPLMVYRRATERPEACATGHAVLLDPTTTDSLEARIRQLLDNTPRLHPWPLCPGSPYGDGHAGQRSARAIRQFLNRSWRPPALFAPVSAT
jgi:UDP-N-acetylglucosamine 2-epimerase (non-hydrolysing)